MSPKKPGNKGTYTCPSCTARTKIQIKGGAWYWGTHDTPGGDQCVLSGKRMA